MSAVLQDLCTCMSKIRADDSLDVSLCELHRIELDALQNGFGWHRPKYQRWYRTEQEAQQTADCIREKYPSEGYGTSVAMLRVGRFWLLRASWYSAD